MAWGGYGAGMTETPAPRRLRWLWIAAIGALAVTAAVAGTLGVLAARHDAKAEQAAGITVAVPPTVIPLSEASACARLVPLLTGAARQLNEVVAHPDGSTADWGLIYRTHDELNELAPALPASLQTDVNIQLAALDQLDKIGHKQREVRDLNVAGVSDAGIRVADTCMKYATG